MTDTCVIKDEPTAEPCGQETFTFLTTSYTFDTDERFEFRLSVCEEHYDALVERYRTEFSDFSIGDEE